ncbi:DUF59 family protein [Cavenderia fasciculata]|uniref:DUF59 family protein n=1 Tax=Cavenderia fasciculata TaxID=261658 RepID=F4QEY7_CACFS|nr:DUF59 family protein [Cavenderia fasciculata]EGG14194.1 DUF59 family protein [Cavenderia fasciculata]|eukprot:XP_004350902.1 DUF59 family protein [Cavenderia fasciculata]
MSDLSNPNPVIYSVEDDGNLFNQQERFTEDEDTVDDFDVYEIFDLVRDITDPEHPLSLEQLNVVRHENIKIEKDNNFIRLYFTPTVPHCSMANIIGLSIKEKLARSLPQRFKVDVKVTPGSHSSESSGMSNNKVDTFFILIIIHSFIHCKFIVNKQLGDKERVSAALDSNSPILSVVNECIKI